MLELFRAEGRVSARIAYVFDNTVDFLTPSSDLIAITRKPFSSPYTVNIEKRVFDKPFRRMTGPNTNASIVLDNNELVVEELGLIIDIESTPIYRPRIPRPGGGIDLCRLRERVEESYKLLNRLMEIMGPDTKDPEVDEAVEDTRIIYAQYLNGEINELGLVKGISKHIGLGRGFTPSYDDYLSGLLSGFNYYRVIRGLDPVKLDLGGLIGQTNIVSLKNIEYSMRLELSGPADELLYNIFYVTERKALIGSIMDYLTIGWNSGYYQLLGILDSLHMISSYSGKNSVLFNDC